MIKPAFPLLAAKSSLIVHLFGQEIVFLIIFIIFEILYINLVHTIVYVFTYSLF